MRDLNAADVVVHLAYRVIGPAAGWPPCSTTTGWTAVPRTRLKPRVGVMASPSER